MDWVLLNNADFWSLQYTKLTTLLIQGDKFVVIYVGSYFIILIYLYNVCKLENSEAYENTFVLSKPAIVLIKARVSESFLGLVKIYQKTKPFLVSMFFSFTSGLYYNMVLMISI